MALKSTTKQSVENPPAEENLPAEGESAAEETPKERHFIVFTGESVVEKHITAKDIKAAGFEDYEGEDFVWGEANQHRVDVTEVPEGVREFLATQPGLKASTKKS